MSVLRLHIILLVYIGSMLKLLPCICFIFDHPMNIVLLFTPCRDRFCAEIASWLRCFSAGVFLCTVLLHILPEVRRLLLPLMVKIAVRYPVSEAFVGAGFFLVLLLEQASQRISILKKPRGDEVVCIQSGTWLGRIAREGEYVI